MKTMQRNLIALLIMVLLANCDSKKSSDQINTENRITVEMLTDYGTITLALHNETPLHRDNFIKLINEKVYDSLLFHRVIENFMIQGGDPDSRDAPSEAVLGNGDLGYTVDAEFHPDLFHKKGALATARDESLGRVSSAIQFFIVQGKVFNDSLLDKAEGRINTMLARHFTINNPDYKPLWEDMRKAIETEDRELFLKLNDSIDKLASSYEDFERYSIPQAHRKVYKSIGGTPHLDQNYTVFGEVIAGLEIVDSIASVETNNEDRPIVDVRIKTVRLKN